jgi:outer membrane protein OmpA-like peptidoglycan-associated protein
MTKSRYGLLSILLVLALLLIPSEELLGKEKKKKEKNKGNTEKVVWKGSPAKIMEQANTYYSLRQYGTAKEGYLEVLKKDPTNYLATYRVGRCSYYTQEYEDAARYFQGAIDIDANANDTAYFSLGVSLRHLDRHRDALEVFETFRRRWKADDDYYKRCKLEMAGCRMVDSLSEATPEYRVECIDLNTASGDLWPSIMKQNEEESYLVFTSHRSQSMGNTMYTGTNEVSFSDLWIAKIENDTTFAVPENVGKPINTKSNDGSSSFSSDGLNMYFTICNQGKLGYGCTIYKSTYDARRKAWGKPEEVEGVGGVREVVVNSRGKTKKVPTYDVQPWISNDGQYLFFVSNRDGGYGGLDVWYSVFEGDAWGEPVNAGPRINSPFNEIGPTLSDDMTKLWFASEGRVGFGGYDIYLCEGGVGAWGEPVNMGAPINSSHDDFGSVWFNKDSCSYFTSNRPGCDGRDDLWYAKHKEKPPISVAVQGLVRDKKTLQPIPFATVILFEIDTRDNNALIPLDTFRTDQSARYNFELDLNKKYKVLGNAPEYFANEVIFSSNVDSTQTLEVNVDIELDRIDIDVPIVLENIYFDFDEYYIRNDAKYVLDSLSDLLVRNPQITIQIGSHTDSNGSEPYNKKLSENRAKSTVVYLIEHGIAPDRLQWFGYGESMLLVYPEKNDQDEQMNRRSEFRILSIEYTPR